MDLSPSQKENQDLGFHKEHNNLPIMASETGIGERFLGAGRKRGKKGLLAAVGRQDSLPSFFQFHSKPLLFFSEELDDIIRYCSKDVFAEENDEAGKSLQIHYDDSAIDRLLDREQVRDEEEARILFSENLDRSAVGGGEGTCYFEIKARKLHVQAGSF